MNVLCADNWPEPAKYERHRSVRFRLDSGTSRYSNRDNEESYMFGSGRYWAIYDNVLGRYHVSKPQATTPQPSF